MENEEWHSSLDCVAVIRESVRWYEAQLEFKVVFH